MKVLLLSLTDILLSVIGALCMMTAFKMDNGSFMRFLFILIGLLLIKIMPIINGVLKWR